jgi:two-component system KDP operon response regulator KdpE
VAHWIDQGHLRGHRTPTGRRRVGAEDLVAFLRNHRMPVPPDLWAAADAAGMRGVLVVEDDPSYRRMLVRYLRRADLGIEVREAGTGVDGLLEIGRTSPAVILLDYGLPDLNADQVIERLLAAETGLGAEVLVVTVGLPPGAAASLRRLGVETVIEKTMGMEAVVDHVRQALARRVAHGLGH